jgi:hypothetical protein
MTWSLSLLPIELRHLFHENPNNLSHLTYLSTDLTARESQTVVRDTRLYGVVYLPKGLRAFELFFTQKRKYV